MDPQVAIDKLHGFETADEIAEFLKDQGIKAFKMQSSSCAISRWVSEVTGEIVTTGVREMMVGFGNDLFQHTDAVAAFINRFDSGFYPELEITGSSFTEQGM